MIRITDTHYFFWSGQSLFSNWTDTLFVWNNRKLHNAETGMMIQKALLFKDMPAVKRMMIHQNPRLVKHIGRTVENFDKDIWHEKCVDLVVEILLCKFSQNADCKEELLSSGNKVIVESSVYDNIWGIGLATNDDRILDEANWKGLNLLGEALMKTRTLIKENPDKIWE